MDQVFTLEKKIQKNMEEKEDLFVSFVNLEKTDDAVNTDAKQKVVEKCGFHYNLAKSV